MPANGGWDLIRRLKVKIISFEDLGSFVTIDVAQFFLEWEMFKTKAEKIKTQNFTFNNFFP